MAQGRYRIRPNGFMRLAATRRLVLLLMWRCVKQEEGLRVHWVYTEGEIPLGQCLGCPRSSVPLRVRAVIPQEPCWNHWWFFFLLGTAFRSPLPPNTITLFLNHQHGEWQVLELQAGGPRTCPQLPQGLHRHPHRPARPGLGHPGPLCLLPHTPLLLWE